LRLGEEMTLPLWHAWGRVHLGWALSQSEATLGLEEIEGGLREAHQIGAGRYEPYHLGIAADAYARAGRPDEARKCMAAAFAGLELGHHAAFAAELYRTRGLLSLSLDRDESSAALDLRRALDTAKEQEALSLELRAARDLARLMAEQKRRHKAIDLLAPIYGRFTEGFHTQDLMEAKTLLANLE
jgi:predicted ATPase